MSQQLGDALLSKWQRLTRLQAWPLAKLLEDGDFYREWVRQAWTSYIQLKEGTATYGTTPSLRFDTNKGLQSLLPRLIDSGTLQAVPVAPTVDLPVWTLPAIIKNISDLRAHQWSTLLGEVTQRLDRGGLGWKEWQALARQWAQLNLWRYAQDTRLTPEQINEWIKLQARVDPLFRDWLKGHYANLSSRKLPQPHHLYHVPGWLAYRQEQGNPRTALLILDGLALAGWLEIHRVWQVRHPAWQWTESSVLAEIPSITAISRQALISGKIPREFAATLDNNRHEAQAWREYWQAHNLPPAAIAYAHLPTNRGATYPDALSSRRTQALCLVSTVIDDMVHGATQGAAEVQAALNIWLGQSDEQEQGSAWLEALIQQLLEAGYIVTLTSDHGHVEATGIGQPQEGVVAISRSKRARLYTSEDATRNVQAHYPATILWHADKLLPDDLTYGCLCRKAVVPLPRPASWS